MLTTARNTPIRLDSMAMNRGSFPMGTGAVLFTGALVVLNSSGYLVRGATGTGLRVAGILGDQPFQVPSDRITNLGADGAKSAEVQLSVTALLNNSDADPITQDDVLNDAWIVDDETVAATSGSGTRSKAGRIIEVTDQGVWVSLGVPGVNVAGSTGPQGATGAQGPQGPQGVHG